MDIGTLLAVLAIVIFAVGYIARPILEYSGFTVTETDRRLSTLQAERDQILMVLQELDMDQAMGKVEEEAYRKQRAELVSKGAAILKEMDRLVGAPRRIGREEDRDDQVTKELEEQIEGAVSRLRQEESDLDSNFCSQCGGAIESSDRFCPHCGSVVRVGEV
jgi:rubrerythrin